MDEMIQSFGLGQSFGKSYLQLVWNSFQFDAFIVVIYPSLLLKWVDLLKLHSSAAQIDLFQQSSLNFVYVKIGFRWTSRLLIKFLIQFKSKCFAPFDDPPLTFLDRKNLSIGGLWKTFAGSD